jgi:Tfp pilus assembly protein PilF
VRFRALLVLGLFLLVGAAYLVGASWLARSRLRAAQAALDERDFDRARAVLRKCLAADPGNLEALLLAARTARRRGDEDEAREHLLALAQRRAPADVLNLERKLLRVQLGNVDEAAALLAHAEKTPDAPETPLLLEAAIEGTIRAFTQRLPAGYVFDEGTPEVVARAQRAVETWLRLRTGKADRAQGLVWRGRLHLLASEHSAAVADFREALEVDPEHFEARRQLAFTIAQEAPRETAEHLRRLLKREPGNTHLAISLAGVLRGLGQLDESRQMLDEILAGEPRQLTALIERGLVDLDAGRLPDAERFLRRALEMAPGHPRILRALSQTLALRGRADEAKAFEDRLRKAEAERKP